MLVGPGREGSGRTHSLLAFVLWPLTTHVFGDGVGERGGACTNFMHGRGLKTIDPRIPTMAGRIPFETERGRRGLVVVVRRCSWWWRGELEAVMAGGLEVVVWGDWWWCW